MSGGPIDRSAPIPDTDAVIAGLHAFANTSNANEALAMLRKHEAVLCTDLALTILDSNLETLSQDERLIGVLGLRRAAIVAMRERGLRAAAAVLYRPDPELAEAVSGFLNAPDYCEMIEQLRRRPLLLSDKAVECLAMAFERHSGEPDMRRIITLGQALVEHGRGGGLDAARRWLRNQLVETIQRQPVASLDLTAPWNDALRLTDPHTEEELAAQIRYNLGDAYRVRAGAGDTADFDSAIGHFKTALDFFTRNGPPARVSGIHRILGNVYVVHSGLPTTERHNLALDHYWHALDGISAEDEPDAFLHTHFMIASCAQEAGRFDEARAHLREGLTAVERANLAQAIDACATLSNAMRHGDAADLIAIGEALDLLSHRVGNLSADTDRNELASTHFALGNVYRELLGPRRSDYLENALFHTEAASRQWSGDQYLDQWAQAQHNLGAAYFSRIAQDRADNIEQAIEHYARALTVHTRTNFPHNWALTQNALGAAWLERVTGSVWDNTDRAIQILEESLKFWDAKGDAYFAAECANMLGAAYIRLASRDGCAVLDRAIDHFEQARRGHTVEKHPERWAQLQNNLAAAYIERDAAGDRQHAVILAEQAVAAIDRDTQAYLWTTLKRNEAAARSNVDCGRNEVQLDAAIKALDACLPILDDAIYPAEHRATQAALGDLWFRRGNWDQALSAYRKAIYAAERVFEAAYTETGRLNEASSLSSIYQNAAFCLIKKGLFAEALELQDRGKTRVLGDAMRLSTETFEELSREQRTEASAARTEIAALDDEMRRGRGAVGTRSAAELGRLIAQARTRLAAVLASAETSSGARLTVDVMLGLIPAGGAAVIPLITSCGGFAFVIPAGSVTVADHNVVPLAMTSNQSNQLLVGSEERPGLLWVDAERRKARSLGSDALRRASNRMQFKIEALCIELWTKIMEPVCARLDAHGLGHRMPLLVIPHGALSLLPLHAAGPDAASPMFHRFDIQQVPSFAVLAQARAQAERQGNGMQLLAVADPLGDLPHAQLECAEIARLFGDGQSDVLTGVFASIDALEKRMAQNAVSRASHLHFACHGFYSPRDPLESGLVLAQRQVLDLSKIMSPAIALNGTSLVTLSACESAMIEYVRHPDEFVGLGAAFLLAGAAAVVGALWTIDDQSTALLMCEFYRRVLAGDSVAAALGGAQRWLSDLTIKELAGLVGQWRSTIPNVDKTGEAGVFLDSWLASLVVTQETAPDFQPYSSPYYSAAFLAQGDVWRSTHCHSELLNKPT